jgi:uncharacterized protein YceK
MKKILILMFVISLTSGCTSTKNYPMVGKSHPKHDKQHANVGENKCGVTKIVRSTEELEIKSFKK